MFSREEIKIIKGEVERFFEKLDFEIDFKISSKDETDETLLLKLKSDEPRVLIGERGKILAEIQRLLRAILIRRLGRIFYLDLDINDYKQKKSQYLKEVAKEMADKAVLNQKEIILPAMSAYERRIIHLELSVRQDVTTESIGREPERMVVIRPYP